MSEGAVGIFNEQGVDVGSANTDILDTDLVVPKGITAIAIQLRPSGASVLVMTRNGVTQRLKNAETVAAGAAYGCMFLVQPEDVINFQVETYTTAMSIDIDVQGIESGVR